MGVPQAVRDRYAQDEPALHALLTYLRPTARKYCDAHAYGLEARVKQLESAAEKLETGRYASWSSLDDLVALTVVVPTSSHIPEVVKFLDETFDRKLLRDRNTASTSPDQFRFNSTRWYGRLRTTDPPPPLEARALELVFEVQVLTAFEHAWSVVTHDVVYKGGDVNWRERRLAAQLKATVEQLDVLVEHFELVASKVPSAGFAEVDAMSTAIADLKALIDDGAIDATLAPDSWTRLGENLLNVVQRGGDRRGAPGRLQKLVSDFSQATRSSQFQVAISGSLFQAVVAYAASVHGDDVSQVPLVLAGLTELYGITPQKVLHLDR